MNAIEILSMKYQTEEINRMFEVNIAKTGIEVEFVINDMKGFIEIPIDVVKEMNEEKVRNYIYNYINSNLERKFIDEI